MSYPQLFEDGTKEDWVQATYRCITKPGPSSVSVNNILTDAPELESLILSNKAIWQAEVRCPSTLYSKTEQSIYPDFKLRWSEADVRGTLFFFSGLYATKDTTLSADGLSQIWQEAAPVQIPRGWQLARSETYASETEASSILTFRPAESLPSGTMDISEDTSTGTLQFIVELAPDIHPTISENRDLQIAGLIAALSRLKGKPYEEADVPYQALKNLFEAAEIVPWDDEDYDPAYAATTIERFIPIPAIEDEEEE